MTLGLVNLIDRRWGLLLKR